MKEYGPIGFVAYIVLLIGGINWGLVGLFKIDLVHAILGAGFFARIVYIIVGAAAGYLIYAQYFQKKPV